VGPAESFSKGGDQIEHLQVVALDVGLIGLELRDRPTGDHEGQVVVGGEHPESPARADVGLEAAVHREPAEVGVVTALQPRLLVVLVGPDSMGDERVQTVGADDHAGPLGDAPAVAAMSAYPGHPAVFEQDVGDAEAFPHLHTRFRRRVHEQFVQHDASRAVRDGCVAGAGAPGEGERAEVERVGMDRRTSRRDDPVEQAPPGSAATPGGWIR